MPTLVIIKGPNAGQRYELGTEATVGRNTFCDVVINSGNISRQHARIREQEDGYYIEDLNSLNGTYLNGERVNRAVRLVHKDRINIHGIVLAFLDQSNSDAGLSGIDDATDLPTRKTQVRSPAVVNTVNAKSDSRIVRNAQEKWRASLLMIRSLGHSLDVNEILAKILDDLFLVFPRADRGYILLIEPNGSLSIQAMKIDGGTNAENLTLGPVDQELAQRVVTSGEAVLCMDEDDEDSVSVLDAPVRSMMCAPLINPLGKTLGVVYLETKDDRHRFEKDDVELLVSVSNVAGQAVEFARLHQVSMQRQEDDKRALEKEIDERIQKEQELAKVNAELAREQYLLNSLVESIPDPVFFKDDQFRFIRVNRAMARDAGFDDPAQLLGKTDADIWSGDFPVETNVDERHIMETGEALINKEEQPILRDGPDRWVLVTKMPLRDENREIVGTFGIARHITEQKQHQHELERLNAELERRNRDLDDFAYIASHDLKEPLRGIANYVAFLAEDYSEKLDAVGRERIDLLKQLCQRMDKLIDELLHYSRLGRAELAFQPTDLNTVIGAVTGLMQISFQQQNVKIVIDEPLPTINCDAVRVRELYHNLIVNAFKYNNNPEKRIEIGCLPGDAGNGCPESILYVRDNGIGIRNNHLEAIFRLFRRLHARDAYGGGTGAGLTFVKQIVERHGGTIWAESNVGEGTTIYFTLASSENGAVKTSDAKNHADSLKT